MMKQFRESNEIAEVAKKFVMINVGVWISKTSSLYCLSVLIKIFSLLVNTYLILCF